MKVASSPINSLATMSWQSSTVQFRKVKIDMDCYLGWIRRSGPGAYTIGKITQRLELARREVADRATREAIYDYVIDELRAMIADGRITDADTVEMRRRILPEDFS